MLRDSPAFESRWFGADSGTGQVWLEWMGSEPGVVVVLLLEGSIRLGWRDKGPRQVPANTLVWWVGEKGPTAVLEPGLGAKALALRYPPEWVRESLAGVREQISPELRGVLLERGGAEMVVTRPLEAEDRDWARVLMAPTLCAAARRLLEGSRMTEFFFRKVLLETGRELFCTRTQRVALERVAKVREMLKANLEEPPSLDALAAACGCNAQYLSRTFSETAGVTISLYLRRMRIERAAEMIAAGRCNVSEAALEVGYQSLSHFSQAFRAEKGVPPSAWGRQGPMLNQVNDKKVQSVNRRARSPAIQ
ncbi:MAG TPA: AraC family transcriptional regulator [Prosthecobacter sp.]|nr:AraC family transcriptional regulator [Prosthecobacter sp.]